MTICSCPHLPQPASHQALARPPLHLSAALLRTSRLCCQHKFRSVSPGERRHRSFCPLRASRHSATATSRRIGPLLGIFHGCPGARGGKCVTKEASDAGPTPGRHSPRLGGTCAVPPSSALSLGTCSLLRTLPLAPLPPGGFSLALPCIPEPRC